MSSLGKGNGRYFETAAQPQFDEIKKLLDDNGFKEKMEGMKRLLALISKGQDVSSLFPDVVKNVVCPNMTVKKLVYMYVVHYAELEPDLALLAINNFQRDMANDNQLQRALGLRVLSSIRLRVTVQVVMLAVKKAAKDGSPFVRKSVAHAIPKLYSLDHDLLPDLEETLQILLKDHNTMVIGSALWAYNEVCPEKFDYLHAHYRKFCKLLIDMDEWGQIMALNVLTRYARTQFTNPDTIKENPTPKKEKKKKKIWEDGDSSNSDEESESESSSSDEDVTNELAADHRLLLRVAVPLLKSRNSAVVMAVATLYFYIAPKSELTIVARPLTRLLRSTREIEYVSLNTMADMAAIHPHMFAPYMSDFFINPMDPVCVRRLKLDILTNIATDGNINTILNELNLYVHSDDKELVTTSIQAIGRCATRLTDVTDQCMRTLMLLISHPSEAVVAESVVVIKKLLQMGEKADFPLNKIVAELSRLLPTVQVPKARAAIVWVVGEYHQNVPLLAPDLLRVLAKGFVQEDDTVKVQILNLGAKLVITNPQQTTQLFQYVLDLAAYDMNYDLRDKARVLRRVALPTADTELAKQAQRLIINKKPAPLIVDEGDRSRFVLGTLSHMVKHKVMGYSGIPDYVEVAPETDRTDQDDINSKNTASAAIPDSGKWSSTSGSDSDSGSGSDSDSYSDSYSGSDSYSDSDSDRDNKKKATKKRRGSSDSGSDTDSNSESDYSDTESGTDSRSGSESEYSESEEEPAPKKKGKSAPAPAPKATTKSSPAQGKKTETAKAKPAKAPQKSLLDFGIELDSPSGGSDSSNFMSGLAGVDLSGGLGGVLAPSPSGSFGTTYSSGGVSSDLPKHALLNHVTGGGLSVDYRFVRRPSMHGSTYNSVQLLFQNHSADTPICNIRLTKINVPEGMQVVPFSDIAVLPPKASTEALISIVFASITQSAKFDISTDRGSYSVSLQPSLGELVRPKNMANEEFEALQKKLGGMNENSGKYTTSSSSTSALQQISQKVLEHFNVATCSVDIPNGKFRFAGSGLVDDKPFLLSIAVTPIQGGSEQQVVYRFNSENTVLISVAANKLQKALKEILPAVATPAAATTKTSTPTTSTTTPATATPTETSTTPAPAPATETPKPATKDEDSASEEDGDDSSDSDEDGEGKDKHDDSTSDDDDDGDLADLGKQEVTFD